MEEARQLFGERFSQDCEIYGSIIKKLEGNKSGR